MLCIINEHTNPNFNLAAEEYYFNKFKDQDIFTLWRNESSIIVGKHQNTLSEINIDYVRENNIPVVRRLSGGGAVFHDLGNLNFTFIMNGEEEKMVDFKKYTRPIQDVLLKLDINAEFSGRNDLTIEGLKFSGNAEHVVKNRVLHHGTLLFSAKMTDLSAALKVSEAKFTDKSVKSVRSRVTNISSHLKQELDIIEFRDMILNHIMETYDDCQLYKLTEEDEKEIKKLVDEKYSKWEWNFGHSPKYNFHKEMKTSAGMIEFNMDVAKKGIIEEIKIYGDFFNRNDIEDIEKALVGKLHSEEVIRKTLAEYDLQDYFRGVHIDELIQLMF